MSVLRERMSGFGSMVASVDVSHLDAPALHELVRLTAGVDAQVAVLRSNVLAAIAGLGGDPVDVQKKQAKTSHSASKRNAKTADALGGLPGVKARLGAGDGMTPEKAALLGAAAEKTSSGDVDGDETLLGKIEAQDEDRAKKTIDAWVRDKQSNGDRVSARQKRIDAREFSMYVKNGQLRFYGNLPADHPENMAHYRRWQAEKSRLWRLDGGRDSAHRSTRSDEQRGADAFANMLDNIDGQPGGLRDNANWCNGVGHEHAPAPPPMPTEPEPSTAPETAPNAADAPGMKPAPCSCSRKAPSRGQVVVVATAEDLDANDPDVLADIVGGGTMVRTELDRLMCNSDLYGTLFDSSGHEVLFHGRKVRHCTDAQWRALLVRDRGCVLTGADPTQCEAHHILPFEATVKGKTDINELAMVSISIHHWLHDNHLTLYRKPDGTWHTRPATPDEIAPKGRKSQPKPKPRAPLADVRRPKPSAPESPRRKFTFTNEITGESWE